ncbi:MAG TPA: ATP-binding cassette domain-containing protein, partial [Gemmatimonadales bacterium]|nr:ATP-binding cassette domain-containing protein [Gemmatimonadales bacterium]
RMMLDIIEPDEGKISILGGALGARDLSKRIGFLPEERGLYKKMKVLDQLVFLGEIRGLSGAHARERAVWWLRQLGLADWAAKKVEDLSKGMQQKVQFAGALVHDPELLILDEPFSGLDPVNSQVLEDTVVQVSRGGRTVLFSTHNMEQAEKMCDRVVIIARGQKVVDGSVAQVKAEYGDRYVALAFTHDRAAADRVLADRSLVASVKDDGASAEAELAAGASADALLKALVQGGVGLSRFEVVSPSLRTIFIAKVGAEAATAPASEEPAHA